MHCAQMWDMHPADACLLADRWIRAASRSYSCCYGRDRSRCGEASCCRRWGALSVSSSCAFHPQLDLQMLRKDSWPQIKSSSGGLEALSWWSWGFREMKKRSPWLNHSSWRYWHLGSLYRTWKCITDPRAINPFPGALWFQFVTPACCQPKTMVSWAAQPRAAYCRCHIFTIPCLSRSVKILSEYKIKF